MGKEVSNEVLYQYQYHFKSTDAVTGIVILERHTAVVRLRNIFLSTFCDLQEMLPVCCWLH